MKMIKQKYLTLLILLALVAVPFIAQGASDGGVSAIIYKVVDWVIGIAVALCALMIVWGGIMILMAAGAADKVSTGRQVILWAVVGLVIVGLAKGLALFVGGFAGVQ